MRILLLNWRDAKHPRAGGADFRLQHVYAHLAKKGHEIILYSCAFAGCSPEDEIDGIKVFRLGNDYTFSFLCARRLKDWIQKHRPDVVVEDLNKLPFYAPLACAQTQTPLLIQMHHLWGSSIFRETFFPMALFVWLSERLIPLSYRKYPFTVVSESTRSELAQLGIPGSQIRVIYNGADLENYQPPQKEERESFIFWIGRLQKYKGPLDAVQVLEKLLPNFPDLKLVIAGDGPFRKNLEQFIQQRGLQEKVSLAGFVDEKEKIELFHRAAVHLQSSYKEGWGLSVIEANACACPVVANHTAGLRDSCRDNETGLLYRYCDISDAADKVQKILTDVPMRDRLVKEGLQWASSFSWKRNAEEILEYLQKIIETEE